jgi:hypothetical protein
MYDMHSLPDVSPISQKDRDIFDEFYRINRTSLDFSNSWLYTI